MTKAKALSILLIISSAITTYTMESSSSSMESSSSPSSEWYNTSSTDSSEIYQENLKFCTNLHNESIDLKNINADLQSKNEDLEKQNKEFSKKIAFLEKVTKASLELMAKYQSENETHELLSKFNHQLFSTTIEKFSSQLDEDKNTIIDLQIDSAKKSNQIKKLATRYNEVVKINDHLRQQLEFVQEQEYKDKQFNHIFSSSGIFYPPNEFVIKKYLNK